MDGAYVTTTMCDNVSYSCRLYYTWAVRAGAHTATFTATDWMGNVTSQTVRFTAA